MSEIDSLSRALDTFAQSLTPTFGDDVAAVPVQSAVAVAVPGADEVSMKQALETLSRWYRSLQLAAGRIVTLYQKSNQGIPCNLRALHNEAVKSYLTYGRAVFAELQKRPDTTVQQTIVDRDGNVVKTLTIMTPVVPTVFVVGDCPAGTSAVFAGPGSGFGAWQQTAIRVGGEIVKWLLISGGVLVATTKLEEWFFKKPAPVTIDPVTYHDRADKYLDCVAKLAAAGFKFDLAEQRCSPILGGQIVPVDDSRDVPWTAIAVGALMVLGAIGGIVAYRKLSRSSSRALVPMEGADGEGGYDGALDPAAFAADEDGAPAFAAPAPTFSAPGQGVPARFKGCVCF